jgi:hypothetical protein
LLGTYCGSNARAEFLDISSSTNSLYIVSNSGSYRRNPKSILSFRAQYNAENLRGWYSCICNKLIILTLLIWSYTR